MADETIAEDHPTRIIVKNNNGVPLNKATQQLRSIAEHRSLVQQRITELDQCTGPLQHRTTAAQDHNEQPQQKYKATLVIDFLSHEPFMLV